MNPSFLVVDAHLFRKVLSVRVTFLYVDSVTSTKLPKACGPWLASTLSIGNVDKSGVGRLRLKGRLEW
jgi:hypothetical protein